MPTTRIPGCIHCRERHLRCDRANPACSNCRKAKQPLACTFAGIKIRHSPYSTKTRTNSTQDSARAAIDTPPSPSAAFASPKASLRSRSEEGLTDPLSQSGSSPRGKPSDARDESLTELSMVPPLLPWGPIAMQNRSPPEIASPGSLQGMTSVSPRTAPDVFDRDFIVRSPSLEGSGFDTNPQSSTFAHRRHPSQHSGRRMVTDAIECSVFEFYISRAGPWLDIVSSLRHFGQTVPRLALTEPVLYYACLAYASYIMFLKGQLDEYIKEHFQNKAIGLLIPLLSPHLAPSTDEALLATTVILRMSEQFSELADDAQHHLNGAFSLFATTGEKWSPFQTDVRGVAFWIYLRESIRLCFLNEQSCQFDLGIVEYEAIKSPVPDEVWTNQMSYLLVKLCNACWGDYNDTVKQSMRDEIRRSLEDWKAHLPDTFQPWCFNQNDYQPFAIMKFLSPWHEIAWQQYYTARVMLAVYAKQDVRSSVISLNQYLETEIVGPARLACSVCFSSDDIGSNINGTHLISWCGQCFTGKEEQRLLSEFLKRFMEETKWPNKTCYERLEQIWKGSRQTWSDPRVTV